MPLHVWACLARVLALAFNRRQAHVCPSCTQDQVLQQLPLPQRHVQLHSADRRSYWHWQGWHVDLRVRSFRHACCSHATLAVTVIYWPSKPLATPRIHMKRSDQQRGSPIAQRHQSQPQMVAHRAHTRCMQAGAARGGPAGLWSASARCPCGNLHAPHVARQSRGATATCSASAYLPACPQEAVRRAGALF